MVAIKYRKKLVEGESCMHFLSEVIYCMTLTLRLTANAYFYKSSKAGGVVTLKDLCQENGSLLSFDEFKQKYTFINYYGLLKAILKSWRQALETVQSGPETVNNTCLISEFCKQKKPPQLVCRTIIQSVMSCSISGYQ